MEGNDLYTPVEEGKEKAKPIICGFWRRLLAFIIDGFILGGIGMVTGALFFDFLAELGGVGRIVGFAAAMLYFGILNSSVGNGQTVGKRILKIQVVSKNAQTISILKSFLRFLFIGVPYFLNGALIPPYLLSNGFIAFIIGLAVFFGGGAIIYLFIFNRRTRQSLHDLIVDTYVINTKSCEVFTVNPMWKGHLAVVGVWLVTVVTVVVFVIPYFANKEPFVELLSVQKSIQESGLVHTATVSVGKSSGTNFGKEGGEKWESSYIATNAVLKRRPSDYEMVIKQIAAIIFESYPKVMSKDTVVISVTYGYDIGLARAWRRQNFRRAPKEWKLILMQKNSENKI